MKKVYLFLILIFILTNLTSFISARNLCGDNILGFLEECDDGNNINGDGCSSMCTIEEVFQACGNNILETGEECDDGNNINGDGCSASCNFEEFCPLDENDYDFIIEFDERLYSSEEISDATSSIIPLALDSGDYSVALVARDYYAARKNVNQPNERYMLSFLKGGSEVALTPATTDLEDYVPFAQVKEVVTENLELSNGADSIQAVHAVYPDTSSANSLKVICVGIKKNPVDPYCGDGIINQLWEECDDGNLIEGDGCDSNCLIEKECCDDSDCPDDEISLDYCYDNDVYFDFTDYFCLNNECVFDVDKIFKQDCGEDESTSELYCSNNDVWKNTNEILRGCEGGSCFVSSNSNVEKHEECGNDYCQEWGEYYCVGDNKTKVRTCYDRGCEEGSCFSNFYTEKETAECAYGCAEGSCVGETYCGDGNLDSGEECDDGNNVDGDGCSSECEIEEDDPVCGDEIINQAWEECDDGDENGEKCDNSDGSCTYCNSKCELVKLYEPSSKKDKAEEVVQFCEVHWECSGWSECFDGWMSRECEDINHCEYSYNKPMERATCDMTSMVLVEEEQSFNWIVFLILIGIALILILIIIKLII